MLRLSSWLQAEGKPDHLKSREDDLCILIFKSLIIRGILIIDESNATCGKILDSIGLDNTEVNRQAYSKLLLTTPCLGQYISSAIFFEETLYQSAKDGKKFVDCCREENIVPGIKVDKGLVPLPGSNNESWCQGLDGLASRSVEYYKQGARFAKWRTVG